MKYLVLVFFACASALASDSISVTLNNQAGTITITATLDATALKAAYAKKKAETGKTDAELKSYRDILILDAIRDAIAKARSAAEQTDAERSAELAAQKARLDAEYAARAALKPTITVNP